MSNRKPKAKAKPRPRQATSIVKKPAYVVVLATEKEPMRITWLNGADPYAAPWHLRKAIDVVEAHLDGAKPQELPTA